MATLTNHDVADMAQRAAEEIEGLRLHIASLAPRAHAYDVICQILGLLPKQAQGYGEDMAHRLRKQAAELRAQPVEKIKDGDAGAAGSAAE